MTDFEIPSDAKFTKNGSVWEFHPPYTSTNQWLYMLELSRFCQESELPYFKYQTEMITDRIVFEVSDEVMAQLILYGVARYE